MKNLVLHFEDAEFAQLVEAKGELTWREFILTLRKKEVTENVGDRPSQ